MSGYFLQLVGASALAGSNEVDNPANFVVFVISPAGIRTGTLFPESATNGAAQRSVLEYVSDTTPTSWDQVNLNSLQRTNRTALLLILTVSSVPVLPAYPQPIQFRRQYGWLNHRLVVFYPFHDRTVANPNQATPLYVFRQVNSNGAFITFIGTPLTAVLPGHTSYNDIRAILNCDFPSTFIGSTPTSVALMEAAIRTGVMAPCRFDGSIRFMPTVHRDSILEDADMYLASLTSVVFEGSYNFAVFDLGDVSSNFTSGEKTVTVPRYAFGTQVPSNALFPEFTGNPFFEFRFFAVPDTYLSNQVTSLSDLWEAFPNATTSVWKISSVLIVSVQATQIDYDDSVLLGGNMSFLCMFGQLHQDPWIDVRPPTVVTAGLVDFASGFSSNAAKLSGAAVLHNFISISPHFNISWHVQPLAGSQRRHLHELDVITFAPSSSEIVVTLTTSEDVWTAVGITKSNGMANADVWLGYATTSPGPNQSIPYLQLSDRKATAQNILPPIDEINNLHLISSAILAGGGYSITFSRAFATGDVADYDIVDEQQSIVWAYGPFDLRSTTPLMHYSAGLIMLNLINGTVLKVPQRTVSFWYIAVLLGSFAVVAVLSLVLRLLPPSYLSAMRPLVDLPLSPSITLATAPEIAFALVLLGVSSVWMYGYYEDLNFSKNPDAMGLTLGHGSQFFFYFCFLSWFRHNPLLAAVFRTHFNRVQHWGQTMTLIVVVLGWVHGIFMMRKVYSVAVLAAVSVTCLFFVTLLSRQGHLRTLLFRASALAAVILVSAHSPSAALGLIPTFLLALVDGILRLRDWHSRSGWISHGAMSTDGTLQMVLCVRSPTNLCTTRPFVSCPGQFLYVYVSGVKTSTPVLIVERVIQDSDLRVPVCYASVVLPQPSLRLLQLARQGQLTGLRIRVEGPYGGMMTRLKWFRSLILIASDSTFGRVLSILQALVYEPDYFSQCSSLVSVVVIWNVRQKSDFTAFAQQIFELLKSPRAFDLHTIFYAEEQTCDPLPSFADAISLAPQAAVDDLPVHTLFTYVPVFPGRPHWPVILAEQHAILTKKGESRASVYAVADSQHELVIIARAVSALNSTSTFTYHLEVDGPLL